MDRLGRRLRRLARWRSEEAEAYLERNTGEWRQIARLDPPDAADIVEELDEEAALELVQRLPLEDLGQVLEEVRPELVGQLLPRLEREQAAAVLSMMTSARVVDALQQVPEPLRVELVGRLPMPEAAEVARLLAFANDSAGGVMSTEVAALPEATSAAEALAELRRRRDELEDLSTVYVVDGGGGLLGTVSFTELVFAPPAQTLGELADRDPVTVAPETDREQVAQLTRRYRLDAVPVADAQGRLLGAVTRDAILEAVQEEASEDFAVASGTGREETIFTPILRSVRMRLPWLVVNLGLALGVVFVIDRQKEIIDRHALLAALMPMIALVGGNGGAQSLAVIIRALSAGSVSSNRVPVILSRQLAIGVLNGVAVAVVAGLIGLVMGGGRVGVVVALAALVNLTIAALAGSGIPVLLKKLGQDPALAASIFLTFITDLVGFGGFLVMATLLL